MSKENKVEFFPWAQGTEMHALTHVSGRYGLSPKIA